MKLPMPSAQEINNIANRTEDAIYRSQSRNADVQLIENAIRSALQIVVDRMNIQMIAPLTVDLSKH